MGRIRGTGNRTTELRLISVFRMHGITGWRRRYPIQGRPDFVFPKWRLAVFVDGCFWHGCPTHYQEPASNVFFWRIKMRRNRIRDRAVTGALRDRGWIVLRLWEHDLRGKNSEAKVMRRVMQAIHRADAALTRRSRAQ